MANFILGTRGSLLAVTQSTIIADQLQRHFPQHQFSLKTIKTQGDIVIDKPLWQIDGKDFFTKELDQALNEKIVDFVVHSYKDLSTERPPEIKLAAITNRVFAHDVLLITKNTLRKIQNKSLTKLRIGTSSPRRQFLLKNKIKDFLPMGNTLDMEFINLRGNINTRIEKLQANKEYDVICLAMAGLDRLSAIENSFHKLETLLAGIELKLLPLSIFPGAPAQGALAIECLSDNAQMAHILSILNCLKTAKEVDQEKTIFKSYGGGCHLALGVHARAIDSHSISIVGSGLVNNNVISVNEVIPRIKISLAPNSNPIFLGLTKERFEELELSSNFFWDQTKTIIPLSTPVPSQHDQNNYFISSEHCLKNFVEQIPIDTEACIWASGAALHQKLSVLGYWVTGDNDSLGSSILTDIKKSSLNKLILKNKNLIHLSHQELKNSQLILWPTYQSSQSLDSCTKQFIQQLERCKIFFWTSFRQYLFFSRTFIFINKNDNYHFCGYGKTLQQFNENNISNIIPLPSINYFINYIQNQLHQG